MARSGRFWPEHDETAPDIITASSEESLSRKATLMQAWLPVLAQLASGTEGENIAARAVFIEQASRKNCFILARQARMRCIGRSLPHDLPFIETIHPTNSD